jgi:hypothetical protein
MIRRILYVFFPIGLVLLFALASSCNYLPFQGDPAAETPGYKIYTGNSKGIPVSFEYPNSWKRKSIESIGIIKSMLFLREDVSFNLSVASQPNKANNGDFTDSNELTNYYTNIYSKLPEFQLLSQTPVDVNKIRGANIIYRFRSIEFVPEAPPESANINQIDIVREVIIDYKGNIYDIGAEIREDRYKSIEKDFDHLINTFKFLN